MSLEPSKVPPSLVFLLPWAEEWGIGDDIYRVDKVDAASTDELIQLIKVWESMENDDLGDWLTGDELKRRPLSEEYVALTCLTMAVDSARVQLRERGVTQRFMQQLANK